MHITKITKERKFKINQILNNLCIRCLDYKHNIFQHKGNNIYNLYCKECSKTNECLNKYRFNSYYETTICCSKCDEIIEVIECNYFYNYINEYPTTCITCYVDEVFNFIKYYNKHYNILIEKRNEYIIYLLILYKNYKNNNNTSKNITKIERYFQDIQYFNIIGSKKLDIHNNDNFIKNKFSYKYYNYNEFTKLYFFKDSVLSIYYQYKLCFNQNL